MGGAANLASLPAELLELVAESLVLETHVSALARASRALHRKLTPHLYRRGTLGRGRRPKRSALRWAAIRGRTETLERAIAAGVNLGDEPELVSFAASHGSLPTVRLVLGAGGADVDTQGRDNWTALCWASHRGDVEVVRLLLAHGADVNNAKAGHTAPLHAAAKAGHVDVARLLLEEGARVDQKCARGFTPLHRAAQAGEAEVVGLLLKHGADPSTPNSDMSTPMHAAAARGDPAILEQLLDHGARLDALNYAAETALELAVYHGKRRATEFLLQRGAGFMTAREFLEVLRAANRAYDPKIARLLVEYGVDVSREADAYEFMGQCAADSHVGLVEYFVKHGIPVPGTDDELTPLTRAVEGSHWNRLEVMKLLLEAGFDARSADDRGVTDLHRAATEEDTGPMELLLEAGADPMAADGMGSTPAHEAALGGYHAALRLLRETPGVDLTIPDAHGRTPLYLAAMRGKCSAISVLLTAAGSRHDGSAIQPVVAAVKSGQREAVDMLLMHDEEAIHAVDSEGRDLMACAERRKDALMEAVLKEYIDEGEEVACTEGEVIAIMEGEEIVFGHISI